MNHRDLDKLLRSVPVPERTEEYWVQFPVQVTQRVRSARDKSNAATRRRTTPVVKWTLGLSLPVAASFFLMLFLQWPTKESRPNNQLDLLRESYRQVAQLFPQQIEAILFTGDDARLQLSDTPEIPRSPPLYVRICPPAGLCVTAVSFSGRKIKVSGTEFEILENGSGEIFVVAKEGVWGPGQVPAGGGAWRVETGWLEQHL